MSAPLVIYGHPASQPSRAVYWTCLVHRLPFELRSDLAAFGSPEFEALNPKRQVPTIVDGDFALYEMAAILGYLADKHCWSAAYPPELASRARVNQYLHFHHNTTRLATVRLMAPQVTAAFGGPQGGSADELVFETIRRTYESPDRLAEGQATVTLVADLIERGYFPDDAAYLCSRDAPTLADFACYEELAQLPWAGLFDFRPWPKISRWLEAMRELPLHDAAHRYNAALGDIATTPNTLPRFEAAIAEAFRALHGLDGVTRATG